MWKKFKNSEFCRKLKAASTNRTVYITAITLLVALAVLITVTAIANRNKKPAVNPGKNGTGVSDSSGTDKSGTGGNTTGGNTTGGTTGGNTTGDNTNGGSQSGTDKDGTEQGDSQTTGALPTSFRLPADGALAKGHDATVQVFSNTMGDWRVHLGVDINTAEGAAVMAAADGEVERIWEDPMMGLCVSLAHSGNCRTVYKNLAEDLAEGITEGATVSAGQKLGTVGDSAILELAEEPHLHFEMTVNGLQVDPLEYFDAASIATLAGDDSYEDLPGMEQTSDGPSDGTSSGGKTATDSKPITAK